MTTQSNFTTEEWALLLKAPYAAALAIMAADPSGARGVINETLAISEAWEEANARSPKDALVNALFLSLATDEAIQAARNDWDAIRLSRRSSPAAEENAASGIERCRQAWALAEQKASPEEAEAYRQLVMSVARTVASAAREGRTGLFGPAISAAEQAALEKIAAALGL